jgi:hypothetical protein
VHAGRLIVMHYVERRNFQIISRARE